MKKPKKIIITDSNSIIHRAFHALPPLTTKDGELVNVVYGFFSAFLKAVQDFNPDFIATCFDLPFPTFRHKKFKEYKAQRPPTPKELYQQIPIVKKLLKTLKVPVFEKKGFEADDLIGTISSLYKESNPTIEVVVLSGDLDLLQLVDKNVKVYLLRNGPKNSCLYDQELVKKKYSGLLPNQLVDFRALRGDPSDNIPGVSGVGEKTAIKLLNQFQNIENLYDCLEKNKEVDINKAMKEKLIQQKDKAFLSQYLARIKRDVPIKVDYKDLEWGNYNEKDFIDYLEKLGFKSLVKRFQKMQEKNKLLKLW